ncbi:MAG: hypothetical protein AAFY88_14510, partial [Acidobacteriota bacterium]
LILFRKWALSRGGEWSDSKVRIPQVEPGLYQICESSLSPSAETCAEGVVYVSGALELSLPTVVSE